MKRGFVTFVLSVAFTTGNLFAQNPEWINYTATQPLYSIVCNGNDVWVATFGGVVKLNKLTETITHYTKASYGLPGNSAFSLAMDSSKNLWVGTYREGIGKLSGTTSTNYNTTNSGLPSDQWNTAIAVDSHGKIFIGSLYWLATFDGINWKKYSVGPGITGGFQIRDIKFEKNGNAWVGTTNGLARFVGDTVLFRYAGIRNQIYSLAMDKNDTLWIGTGGIGFGAGLWKFDGVSNYVVFDTTNSGIPDNNINDMEFDPQGNLWLATSKGLGRFDGTTWKVYNKSNSNIDDEIFTSLAIDKDGVLWLGRASIPRLFRFDGTTWKTYDLSNSGLGGNFIKFSFSDNRGNRWMIDAGKPLQLIRYDGSTWTHHDTTSFHSLDSLVGRIYDDGSRVIWADSAMMISYSSSVGWTMDNVGNTHTGGILKIDKQRNIWEVSNVGLRKFDGQNWTVYNTSNTTLPSSNIVRVGFDFQDNIWVTTLPNPGQKGYLAKSNGTTWTTVYTCGDLEWIPAFEFAPSGTLWFGVLLRGSSGPPVGGGLVKYSSTGFTNYTISNSELPSNSVVTLAIDKSENVWAGTYGGGMAKLANSGQWTVYNLFNSALPDDDVEFIDIDKKNNKWIRTQEAGLTVYREGGVITAVAEPYHNQAHLSWRLEQSYPNPFNATTILSYTVPIEGYVSLDVYDVLGRRVKELVQGVAGKGSYQINFDASSLPSGVYLYRLNTPTYTATKKMLLLR